MLLKQCTNFCNNVIPKVIRSRFSSINPSLWWRTQILDNIFSV